MPQSLGARYALRFCALRRCLLLFAVCLLPFEFAALAQTKRPAKTKNTAAPSARPSAQFEQLTQRADAARAAENLDEAVSLYLQALRLQPKWKEGWWYVGTIFYEGDRYVEGRDAFRNFVAIDSKFGPALSLLGLCEFQLKQYELALDHLQRGNALGLGDNQELRLVARYHEAILHNRFAQHELAYDALIKVIGIDNPAPDLLLALGLTMLRMPYLPVEVPSDKREMTFKAGRAAYLAATNRTNEAAAEYRGLVAAYANEPGVHYAYGVFLLRGTPDDALAEFRRELELAPQHVAARLQIAFEYIKRGAHAEGKPYAEEAVRLAPELFATHNALGRILLELGDVDRAIKELETGAKLAPTSPEMYFALARAYARAGRTQDAARARAEFARLDKIRRAEREGIASDAKPQP